MRFWFRRLPQFPDWTTAELLELRLGASRDRFDQLLDLRAPQILLDNELDIQRRLKVQLGLRSTHTERMG